MNKNIFFDNDLFFFIIVVFFLFDNVIFCAELHDLINFKFEFEEEIPLEISFILQSNFIIKKYTRRVYENKEVLLNTQENKKIIEDSEKMKENIIEYYQKEIINGIIFTIDGDCIVVRDGFVIIIENYKLKMEKNLNIFKDKIANNVLSVVENKIKKYLKMRLSLINFYEFFFNKSNKFNKYKEDQYAAVW